MCTAIILNQASMALRIPEQRPIDLRAYALAGLPVAGELN